MSDEEFDLRATTLDRVSELVEELADDTQFVMTVIDAAGGNYGSDESAAVKKVINEIAQEILGLW